ncbi:MAG: ATP-binding protein [Rhodocyclaceae bacterium]|nr:ATP-binding protein [Rhodocyclaceae bacterium]
MKRTLSDRIVADLDRKLVILTGPRQVGKTTLAQQLMAIKVPAQYLNWDIPEDRTVLLRRSWDRQTRLLVMDEIHKMSEWKTWLKGIVDGRAPHQALLVTGSARMDTFRQSGESLAGRYFSWHLHPISVHEWCATHPDTTPEAALRHLMQRGGFPEPCLASTDEEANRWRAQYASDLIREDILEFSRLHEVNAMRLFLDILRSRVGSPLSLASIARDLAIAPSTLKRYLDILQALFIVFTVQPWHRNIARATLQASKVYFYDTGMVQGDEGIKFENATATMLLKHVHFRRDSKGCNTHLHYLRTKDGAEVDFAISEDDELVQLIECKYADNHLHRALTRFAEAFPTTQAIQLVANLRQNETRGRVAIRQAGDWLAKLEA